MSFKTVIIVGATGLVGFKAALAFLESNKFTVSILAQAETLKNAEKNAKLEQLKSKGAHIVQAELTDVAALTSALKGIDVVVSTVNGVGLGLQAHLIEASKAAGVKRFLPSEFGSDITTAKAAIFGGKEQIRSLLENSGLEYTYILTGFFFETTFYPWFGWDLPNGKVAIPGTGNEKISFSKVEDFTAVLPEVVLNPKSKNASVKLISQDLSSNEVVAIVEKAHGKKLQVTYISAADLEKEIKSNPNPFATFAQQLQLIVTQGFAKVPGNSDVAEYTQRKFQTLEDFFQSSK